MEEGGLSVTAFDPKWLLFGCRRRAWTAFGVFDIRACSFCKLFKEKGALESHLLYASMVACDSESDSLVPFLNFIHPLPKLNAFPPISLLYRRREDWWYTSCAHWSSCRWTHGDARMADLLWEGLDVIS